MALVAELVSVTLTPATTAPFESETTPLISPDGVWADIGKANATRRRKAAVARKNMGGPPYGLELEKGTSRRAPALAVEIIGKAASERNRLLRSNDSAPIDRPLT